MSISGLCGLILGKCNGCNHHADKVILKNTDMPGFDGQANPEHIAVFVVVEHSFAESVVVLQGKKQIDFAAGYGFTLGMIWGTIWNVGIDLVIQIVFLCLPTGAMATQKEDSKFFENKSLF